MTVGRDLRSTAVNPRLFMAGDSASECAATRWLGVGECATGARSLLFEAETFQPPAGVPWFRSNGHRRWWSGSFAELRVGVGSLHESLHVHLNGAIDAFQAQLYAPCAPKVMGILNVTPDSFSDGGRWLNIDAAVERGLQMLAEGADLLDIGGESTRPGASEVSVVEEIARVLPVLERLRREAPEASLSVDTRKEAVARRALDTGADWINDVSGLAHDPEMAKTVAAYPSASLVIMHSVADPQRERYSTEWREEDSPDYEDVVADVMRDIRARCKQALHSGVRDHQIWIDPGFGFGKTFEQNVEILKRLREFTSIGLPVLVGTSRKSTVGKLAGGLPPEDRLEATAATVTTCVLRGASAVRVHDVKEMARVVKVASQL